MLAMSFAVACVGQDPSVTIVNTDDASGVGNDDSGGTNDRDATIDAGPDGAASVGNVLRNPDFEQAGCNGWIALETLITDVPVAHAGNRSCRVCSSGAGVSVYGLGHYFASSRLTPGVTYEASAWLRATEDDAGAVASSLHLAVALSDGITALGSVESSGPALDGTWQRITRSFTYEPVDGGTGVSFDLLNRGMDNGCFLVDDASFAPSP
jgi:hypothetical protein